MYFIVKTETDPKAVPTILAACNNLFDASEALISCAKDFIVSEEGLKKAETALKGDEIPDSEIPDGFFIRRSGSQLFVYKMVNVGGYLYGKTQTITLDHTYSTIKYDITRTEVVVSPLVSSRRDPVVTKTVQNVIEELKKVGSSLLKPVPKIPVPPPLPNF